MSKLTEADKDRIQLRGIESHPVGEPAYRERYKSFWLGAEYATEYEREKAAQTRNTINESIEKISLLIEPYKWCDINKYIECKKLIKETLDTLTS